MTFINRLSTHYPLSTSIAFVVLSILFTQLGAVILANIVPVDVGTLAVFTRYGWALVMLIMLRQLNGLNTAGVSTSPKQWHTNWLLATCPLLVVVGLNLSRVHWQDLAVDFSVIPQWLLSHLATGLFEELMMRAVVFFLLAKAWAQRPNGLMKAAIAQAGIFGALHLLNLLNGLSATVVIQAAYATCIGIAFAGIVAFTRTIWPVVIMHTLINAASSINRKFVPDYSDAVTSIDLYLMFTAIIFVATTLPALYMLRQVQHANT